jgi:hypothetical protein
MATMVLQNESLTRAYITPSRVLILLALEFILGIALALYHAKLVVIFLLNLKEK